MELRFSSPHPPDSFGYGAIVEDEGRAVAFPTLFAARSLHGELETVEELIRALVYAPHSWGAYLEISEERFDDAYRELVALVEPYVGATFARVARGAAPRRKFP
jgi:hypothetical protein